MYFPKNRKRLEKVTTCSRKKVRVRTKSVLTGSLKTRSRELGVRGLVRRNLELRLLHALGEEIEFRPGEVLCKAGDVADRARARRAVFGGGV